MQPPRSGQLKRLPRFQSPLTAIRKSLQKPSNVDVPVSYQPPYSHRRLAGDSRRRKRLLVDRPAVADRRAAEAGGNRKSHGAARLQARAEAAAETGNTVPQRPFPVRTREGRG